METPRAQQTLAWREADRAILEAVAERSRVLIAVTGPVGSGKSTLAKRLSHCVVHSDDFLPDHDLVGYDRRDDPAQADLATLKKTLASLAAGEPADVPVWSFQTHRREGSRTVRPEPVVVVEGIHAFHESIRPLADLLVYVDAPADVRWKRWEHLELTGQRGWGVDRARRYFDEVAEPTFSKVASEYLSAAHFVVRNDPG
jgi:pantothenate kinase